MDCTDLNYSVLPAANLERPSVSVVQMEQLLRLIFPGDLLHIYFTSGHDQNYPGLQVIFEQQQLGPKFSATWKKQLSHKNAVVTEKNSLLSLNIVNVHPFMFYCMLDRASVQTGSISGPPPDIFSTFLQ